MTLENAKRLVKHYEETNQKERADELLSKHPELTKKSTPKKTAKAAVKEEEEKE